MEQFEFDLNASCNMLLGLRGGTLASTSSGRGVKREAELPDATRHYWLLFEGQRRFVAVSSETYPDSVANWIKPAREIASLLPPKLALTVVLPEHEGRVDGRSFAIWQCYCDWSRNSALRSIQLNLRLVPTLRWLEELAVQTRVKIVTEKDRERLFLVPLRYLANEVELSPQVRETASMLLDDPQEDLITVAHHGDFWWGNVLHDRSPAWPGARPRVIDWGTGCKEGYPFYDALRLLSSSRWMAPQVAHSFFSRHSQSIGLPPAAVPVHVCAALGMLGLNRRQFPMKRYGQLVERQLTALFKIQGGKGLPKLWAGV